MYMHTRGITFFIILFGVLAFAYLYLNRDALFGDDTSAYCRGWQETLSQETYSITYTDRIKALFHGCI